jgi:hypothetical protein
MKSAWIIPQLLAVMVLLGINTLSSQPAKAAVQICPSNVVCTWAQNTFCGTASFCNVTFPALPAGKSFTITHASCLIMWTRVNSDLGIQSIAFEGGYLKPGYLSPAGVTSFVTASESVSFRVPAGSPPVFWISMTGKAQNLQGNCVISGKIS